MGALMWAVYHRRDVSGIFFCTLTDCMEQKYGLYRTRILALVECCQCAS
jgi:hypothetical protein